MANNPSFSLYVNDFEGGTRHMNDEELGCYIRLLFAQFNRGKLPNNHDFLRRFCTSFDKSWAIVAEKFEKIGDDFIQNKRLDTEIQKRDNFIDKQQVNGRKGGRPPIKIKPTKNPLKTQTKTQKKPLGNGIGNGNGKGIREREGKIIFEEGQEGTFVPPKVSMPFNGTFEKTWTEWKNYKLTQHQFSYKSGGSEQAALHELVSLAYGKEEDAIAIIHQSMAKGWKGLFPIKNKNYATAESTTTKQHGFSREGVQAELAERLKNRE